MIDNQKTKSPELHPARWWQPEDDAIRCQLCPRKCRIPEDKNGYCGIRRNIRGQLYSLAYGRPVALQVDPIEKKPLAEFMPGTWTFSLGTYGCNLGCVFCQNHHLSRGQYPSLTGEESYTPEKIVELARENDCKSIAFTYNEPLIWGEYIIDIAKFAEKQGLATVLVSNAYVSPEARQDILPLIDAANFDMKGFSEEFYREMTGSQLQPVLETIEYFYSLKKHVELTNLIIPGKNDNEEMINDYLDWVEKKLDKNVPLHFSAYHPDYQYNESPRTPAATLYKIRDEAQVRGFEHIYLGNIL